MGIRHERCRVSTTVGPLKQNGIGRQECPLLDVKRTWRVALQMSAYDPKRTSSHPPPITQLKAVLCCVLSL